MWLKKAELHIPQTGLKCWIQQACNYMQYHDRAWLYTILLHKGELLGSIHKRKCYKDSFLSRIKRDTSQHIFFQQFILMKPSLKDNAPDLGIFLICPGGVGANQEKQEQWWDPSQYQQMSRQIIPMWEVNLLWFPWLPFLSYTPSHIPCAPFPTRQDHTKSIPNRWHFLRSKAPRKVHLIFFSKD